ncbi:MAG TPA: condensation domain-containing protein, partial [Bacteroidia bacterium]|nr:condensation domain-containing protein [Bacteroidia bacterium]
ITNYTFDISVLELLGTLVCGLKLLLISDTDPFTVLKLLSAQAFNVLQITPSRLNQLLNTDPEAINKLKHLKVLLIGGEALNPDTYERLKELTTTRVINVYGPTETTIWSTCFEIKPDASLSIGKPLLNESVLILNNHNKLSAVGVVGEICIGGDGLARGYINKPELTKEKFSCHPFKKEERIYKTGDLGKWLPDGNIEFIGRKDDQVKVRGYRIELGEIENTLQRHQDINSAVVMAKRYEGEMELVAYIVGKKSLQIADIRSYLSQSLPVYMLPNHYVQLDEMPLNSSGKVDRKRLPDGMRMAVGTEYIAPRNETEEALVLIWQELLGKDKISVKDNFFDLGGHSLKATWLISKIFKTFEVKLELKVLFANAILEKQAVIINSAKKTHYTSIEPVNGKEYYPLSSGQKRVFFLHEFASEGTTYNMPFVQYLGKTADKYKIESALKQLIDRHESLRTSFHKIDGTAVQKIHEHVPFELDEQTCTRERFKTVVDSYIRVFDLSKAPLLRSALVHVTDVGYIWIVDMHHIISDGTSIHVMINDFSKLYHGIQLPELQLQYKDFSEWQNRMIEDGEFDVQKTYWLSQFSQGIPSLNFPADRQRPAIFTFEGASYKFSIDPQLSMQVNAFGSKHQGTLQMTLLAVLNTLLFQYTGQDDLVIGCGIAGRRHPDIEHIVGMFVNSLAIRNFPSGEKTFSSFYKEVVSNCIAAYENQDIQFEYLLEILKVERDASRNPIFDVSLIVQNFERSASSLEELMNIDKELAKQIEYKSRT